MVPNGWDLKNLGRLATKIGSGVTPKGGSNAYKPSGIPLIRSQNVLWGNLDLSDVAYIDEDQHAKMKGSIVYKNDVLLNITGASIGRSAVSHLNEANVNQHVCIIRSGALEPEYLKNFLLSFYGQKQIEQFQAGGNRQGLNFEQIKSFKLPVPPLPEQRKIAQILSTWDRGIATTEKLIDASKQQKKALMQQLLTGKKRLIDPETGKAFEGDWEEAPLSKWLIEYKEKSSIQDQHRVFTSSKSGLVPQDEYFGNSRIADRKNIGFHVLPPNHMTYRSRSDDGFFTFNLFKGCENGIISHYYPVFSSKGENNFFIALLEQYRGVFGKHSVGTSQKVLSFNALKSIKFRIPEKSEQQKIASVLTAADKEIKLLEAKLTHLKQEKKALMQQLLTGKRRVKVAETEAA